jgi:hypothetical protein
MLAPLLILEACLCSHTHLAQKLLEIFGAPSDSNMQYVKAAARRVGVELPDRR